MVNAVLGDSPRIYAHRVNYRGIINPGRHDCHHFMIVSEVGPGHLRDHELGRCRYCGRVVDYTVLRENPSEQNSTTQA